MKPIQIFAVLCFVLQGTTATAETPLRPRQTVGTNAKYFLSISDTTYTSADTSKIRGKRSLAIPMQVTVKSSSGSSAKLEVVEGPLAVDGSRAGLAKIHHLSVDTGGTIHTKPAAFFLVPFPTSGAKIGQTWRGGFYGPSPLPNGITATYRYQGNQGPYAKIGLAIDFYNLGCRIVAKGDLFVRLSDGYLDHGNAQIHATFMRPDNKNPGHLKVAYRDILVCSIDQK